MKVHIIILVCVHLVLTVVDVVVGGGGSVLGVFAFVFVAAEMAEVALGFGVITCGCCNCYNCHSGLAVVLIVIVA